MAEFDKGASALGIITPEVMQRFPAATYLLGRQANSEAGLDVSDPRNVARALQSRTAQDRTERALEAQSKRDSRTMNRLLGAPAPVFGVAPDAPLTQQLDEGARIQSDSLMRNIAGRNIAGRQIQQENDRLAKLAEADTAIDAREKKLKDKVLQGIERNIMDVQNKALGARAILRSQLGNMSPAQRNAVLAAQGAVFTEQINNLQSLRSAREGAIDSRVKDDREALELQVKASEQRIKGLQSAIGIMEQNGADASAIADIRVKLAQEKEKLRKKTGGTQVTRNDIVMDALIKSYKGTHGGNLPDETALKDLKRQTDLILSNDKLRSMVDNPNRSVNLGSALEFAGFGIQPTREETLGTYVTEAEQQGKLDEAGWTFDASGRPIPPQ